MPNVSRRYNMTLNPQHAQYDGKQDARSGRPCRVKVYQDKEQRKAYLTGFYTERKNAQKG